MNFSHQLKEMQLLSNIITKQRGVFQYSNFYDDLLEFIPFYEDNVQEMKMYFVNDSIIKERLDKLPEVEIKEHIRLFTKKTWLRSVIYLLVLPTFLIHWLKKYRYVQSTKQQLKKISSILSSIEVLTRQSKF